MGRPIDEWAVLTYGSEQQPRHCEQQILYGIATVLWNHSLYRVIMVAEFNHHVDRHCRVSLRVLYYLWPSQFSSAVHNPATCLINRS